ncbi:MAG: hypothetical protein J6I49_07445 [Bacteroidales bacterium]|nr:hypothetical protein [Bacteroidales bacterium]
MKPFRRYHSTIHGNYRRAYFRCGLLLGVALMLYILMRMLLGVPAQAPESYATDGILIAGLFLLAFFYRNSLEEKRATLKELMLFGFGTAALAALLYGLFLWALGLARPDQAALFATATTGATPTADDPQIHYWAAFVALVATVKLLLIGTFAAFIAAVLFRNEKGKMKNEE